MHANSATASDRPPKTALILAKAAECFVTELAFVTAKEVENSPRKVIQYVDVFNAFMKVRENGEKDWRFLDEILPPKKRMKKD